jgi:methylglutaconyl-CoA hydratase
MSGAIILDVTAGRATVTLNRPELHNAFDDALIGELTAALERLGQDGRVRAIVLTGAGKSFSAGGDLNWMKRMAGYSFEENLADAGKLAGLMQTLDRLPKPTIARVNGAAFGGGVGLVGACDMAVASANATFCLSEVKLGIIPAAISPYVVRAMGARAARRYWLTAERFDAAQALRIGLVHSVVAPEALDGVVDEWVSALLANGPEAIAACKDLIAAVAARPVDEAMIADTARRITERRSSAEGREGVGAFLEKRKPSWQA